MNPFNKRAADLTRRQFFARNAMGLGVPALASLLPGSLSAGEGMTQLGGLRDLPHFPPKVKNVIYLLQNGAPPHVDMYDHKPQMEKWRGKELPESVHKNQRLSTMTAGKSKAVLPAFSKFKQYGECGAWLSGFLPHIGSVADEICFIKSMHTTQVNHAPAITFFLTGAELPGRPSMGAWATYGLGSETQELPGFVVMTSRDKEASCGQIFYDFYWG
ncbi:MAG: DUF1501 domain-containing protein, partial [Planctomycetaceae bacterium]|nr:DUF1501 domain-containing protein [Planctomycetaceae bacterium]